MLLVLQGIFCAILFCKWLNDNDFLTILGKPFPEYGAIWRHKTMTNDTREYDHLQSWYKCLERDISICRVSWNNRIMPLDVYILTMLMARHQKITKLFDEDFWVTRWRSQELYCAFVRLSDKLNIIKPKSVVNDIFFITSSSSGFLTAFL